MTTRPRTLLTSLLAFAALLLCAPAALATASFDFVSSGGQFSIANDTLSFGNGLTISAARASNVADPSLIGASILLDPIELTGDVDALPGGFFRIGIAPGQTTGLEIYQSAMDGGALLATATYDPGEFVALGAGGILSGDRGPGVLDIALTPIGTGYSPTLDALVATQFPSLVATQLAIDFNVVLTAAGQDIAQRIDAGTLVTGAVAGSAATFVPEPSTALLMGLGLASLSLTGGRRSSRS